MIVLFFYCSLIVCCDAVDGRYTPSWGIRALFWGGISLYHTVFLVHRSLVRRTCHGAYKQYFSVSANHPFANRLSSKRAYRETRVPIYIAKNESSIEAKQAVRVPTHKTYQKKSPLLLNSSSGGIFLTLILKARFIGMQALFTVCFRSELSNNI